MKKCIRKNTRNHVERLVHWKNAEGEEGRTLKNLEEWLNLEKKSKRAIKKALGKRELKRTSSTWERSPRVVLGTAKHPDHGLWLGKIKCNLGHMEGVDRYKMKPSENDTDNGNTNWIEEYGDYWPG
tara:strand:- start:1211 stop:1588 length:378 start_codon:yes stop_codon:yes gene_type:complete